MLSAPMIAAMRSIANSTMAGSLTVSRVQSVDDGFGTKADQRTTVHTGIICRVQVVPRTPNTMAPPGTKQEYANHIVKVPWGTDILASDWLLVVDDKGNTSEFQVDSPYDNMSDAGTSAYYCFKKS